VPCDEEVRKGPRNRSSRDCTFYFRSSGKEGKQR
jgi:hypothetical protein